MKEASRQPGTQARLPSQGASQASRAGALPSAVPGQP
eukprot:CAMPEP_0177611898 /NCGR_PEP_ID=MMETSP0419_2-20121207/20839_1 /TAXON_ID=582737 /ORGANISM="Tetraselmis sp., Strain GSL018" /LENGTH=36 /DNA_ID= /DNA_START= /DNA_END= /DNA_ORIENTATION=